MLGRLGLMLPGTSDVGNQCHVDEQAVLLALLQCDLPDGLQKRLALNVTHCAADLRNDHIAVAFLADTIDKPLDLIRDMRDDLDCAAQILPFSLLVEHVPVNLPCCQVGEAIQVLIDEAFVMAKVQIRLRTIFGHENFSMLKWTHCPRVHIDVGIQLL